MGLATASLPLAAPAPATAEPGEVHLAPASPWNVDWADNYCTLQRQFGPEDHPFLLRLRSYDLSYNLEFMLVGEAMTPLYRSNVKIGLGDNPARELGSQQTIEPTKVGPGILATFPLQEGPPGEDDRPASADGYPDPGYEKTIDRITLVDRKNTLVLETGNMHPALAALRKCMDDLVTTWGLDPAVQKHLSRKAKMTNMQDVAGRVAAIYPSAMAERGKQARINVLVLVDGSGKVARCSVLASYNNPAFNDLACREIRKHARFEPALDSNGNAVGSFWTTRVVYRLD